MREQFNAWFKQHYGDIDTTHFPVGVAEDAFAAGHAAGLEAAAVECDKQEKSLYSTLNGNSDAIPSSIGAGICAEAIRAMKP